MPAGAARFSRGRHSRRSTITRSKSGSTIRRPTFSICWRSIRSRRCIRGCLEKYGAPAWTRPENIVTNGAFLLTERRIRDRIRLTRSHDYWDRENVRLNVIDALSIDDRTTALNLYMTGKVDWVTVPPPVVLRAMLAKDPPPQRLESGAAADDLLLPAQHDAAAARRRARSPGAVAGARSRGDHARGHGGRRSAGVQPRAARDAGLQAAAVPAAQSGAARKLLAEAGYPDGHGFPKLEIHYNTDQGHQAIAELVRKQWQRELGITVTLRNEEWASSQDSQQQLNYMVSRRVVGRRLSRPEHVPRHVRHRRRKQQHRLLATPSTTS